MRVIAGEFRSRRLKTPPGFDLRPTPERLRETLFDILQTRIEGAIFLDAYAGTGAVGIEALSRGAKRAIFLEKNRAAVEVIHDNLRTLGLRGRATVISGPAHRALGQSAVDIAFLDPPYPLEDEYASALEMLASQAPGLTIAQHSSRFDLQDRYGVLERTRRVKQGDNVLSFYVSEQPQLDGRADSDAEDLGGGRLVGGDLDEPGAAGDGK